MTSTCKILISILKCQVLTNYSLLPIGQARNKVQLRLFNNDLLYIQYHNYNLQF